VATQFELFIQTELPTRPSVALNPPQETVLVRRGVGPRVYESVDINEGEVLGKINGAVQSVSNSATVPTQSTIIPPQTTSTLLTFPSLNFKSKKLLIEIDQNGVFESYECLALNVSGGVDFSVYGNVGIESLSDLSIVDNGVDVLVELSNNNVVDTLNVVTYRIT